MAKVSTHEELEKLTDSWMEIGQRSRFKVKEVFRGPKEDFIDVWSNFSDCGFFFQPGETYLVYARRNKNKAHLETGSCSRTRRLSDAGNDLGYLFFFQRGGANAARFNGFVTSNDLDLRTPRYWDSVNYPVAGIDLKLKSEHGVRYTSTDRNGRFIFDGLASGDYSIAVFGQDEKNSLLAGPETIHIEQNKCATDVILVHPSRP